MKAIPLPDGKFVSITWVDSNFSPGWANKNRITASIPSVKSVGWVTYSDKKILELTNHLGDEGAKLNATSVPWRSITSFKEVEL